MKKFTRLGVLAVTLFTLAFAPLAQASAAGYGQGQYHGSVWSQNNNGTYQQVRHKKGYKHHRGYRDRGYKHRDRRMHRCDSPRYRWSKECRRYHRGWRR